MALLFLLPEHGACFRLKLVHNSRGRCRCGGYHDLGWNKVTKKTKNYGVKETVKPAATDEMWLREELLKSIWHAFRALDLDQRGKVSKSQLKVRSKTSNF